MTEVITTCDIIVSNIPNTPSNDLLHLFEFLHGDYGWETLTYDAFVPILHRLTHFKSIETFVSDLQSIGSLNDDSMTKLLSLLSHAGTLAMLIDAHHHMVK